MVDWGGWGCDSCVKGNPLFDKKVWGGGVGEGRGQEEVCRTPAPWPPNVPGKAFYGHFKYQTLIFAIYYFYYYFFLKIEVKNC